MRASGILMHISSLPSPYGIGTMGKGAYEFADFLHDAGQHYWQLLPLGPTGFGDSPYQSCSSHAGNPYFIDPDLLVEDGLLLPEEAAEVANAVRGDRVDYGFQYQTRLALLYKAFRRGADRYAREIDSFRTEQPWVDDYALYMAVKRSRNMEPWSEWPEEIRLRKPYAVQTYATALALDEVRERDRFDPARLCDAGGQIAGRIGCCDKMHGFHLRLVRFEYMRAI